MCKPSGIKKQLGADVERIRVESDTTKIAIEEGARVQNRQLNGVIDGSKNYTMSMFLRIISFLGYKIELKKK